jgi:hypothetical protein
MRVICIFFYFEVCCVRTLSVAKVIYSVCDRLMTMDH